MIYAYTNLRKSVLRLVPFLLSALAFGQNGALHITEPVPQKDHTIMTAEPALTLKGTLVWSGGDRRVFWQNNRGFSDLATVALAADGKTIQWSSTTAIPLRRGINHIRVKALGQPGAADFVNVFYSPRSPEPPPAMGAAIFQGRQITYEVRNGLAIYQDDIILGSASEAAAGKLAGRIAAVNLKHARADAITIGPNLLSPTGLWPIVNGVVRIPYTNPSGVNQANVDSAVAEANTQLAGIIQWVPATASDVVNLVEFNFDPNNPGGGCESDVGMQSKPQQIGGSYNCTVTTILHEMGHTMGLFHEQSRLDRDSYVNYFEQNIDKPQHGNFDIMYSGVDSGLFNYASIMEYGPFSFDRDGLSVVLETIPAGMVLSSGLPQYSTGDLDGLMRLYAHAPNAITVDTNPSGLQVIVDGTPCTAPCLFSGWSIGSQHTLGVPLDSHSQTLQTLSQQNYIFGRWNAGAANVQTITVTNSAGNGTLLQPTTSPAITNYLASFIPVHPYNPVVAPGGDGTITPSPSPSTMIINGSSTKYYLDRQLITMTVNPNPGWTLYFWYNLPGFSLYANPYVQYVTENLDYLNFDPSFPVTAGLNNDAVTTITAASPDISSLGSFPGFAIGVVDGNGNTTTAFAPRNYDASGDGPGFASGAHLTLCASALNGTSCPSTAAAQSPVTTNISYLFNQWTGAQTASADGISVTVPTAAGQSTYKANYTPNFRTIVEPSWTCGGNQVTSNPTGTNSIGQNGILDAFFNPGNVTFTATAGSGMAFVGWSQDFSGTTNPLLFSLQNQTIGTANFNIPGTTVPLNVTSVSPATPTVSSGPLDLTVNGTGFTTNSSLTFAYLLSPTGIFQFRSTTLVSTTQLIIHLQAGDLSTAGFYQITVLNVGGCNPQSFYSFPVANSAGPPELVITKSHVGNFDAGQQNAQYTILVSNAGTGSTVDPVTVTETVPAGETLVSMAGSGWTCPSGGNTCTRSDSLAAGLSYGAITVTVSVAANATSPQVNTAMVSGGGASSATATDSTTIIPEVSVPNVVGDTQAAATTAITGSGLVVGTVTTSPSNTVPAGDVISENPVANTMVVAGSAVNLVVSSGPGGPPTIVSLSPNSGTGLTQTFTAVYSDPNGISDLKNVIVLFNTSSKLSNACAVLYVPGTNKLFLYNDTGTTLSAAVVPGSSATASNSQCTLAGTGSSVSKSGNNLTLNVALTFTNTFLGQKNVYLSASGANGSTGFVQKGTWTPSSAGPPTVVSLSPSSGTGLTQTFTAVYSDPNGVPDLSSVALVFNTSIKLSAACAVLYEPGVNKMFLYNDAGTKLSSGVVPGSSGSVSNSQCTLSGTGSSVSVSGNNLTLKTALTFTGTFIGQKNVYLHAVGKTASSSWVQKGTWTP